MLGDTSLQIMKLRQEHQQEVLTFLQKHLSICEWTFSHPQGSGMETYYVQGNKQRYFVKINAPIERYLAMAEIGLTPPILLYGKLESGRSILVQPFIEGTEPSRLDFRHRLGEVAEAIRNMHRHPQLIKTLPTAPSDHFKGVGLQALTRLRYTWESYREQVPSEADFVDHGLDEIEKKINLFSGEGLVASHGDICNANWLFSSDGKIYIVDLETMALDDPAADMGALLWWYYPPELREQFLHIAGYSYNEGFQFRMQVRMAMHCLSILLPRENSFDTFEPENFSNSLDDFKAVMNGEENPQGYD